MERFATHPCHCPSQVPSTGVKGRRKEEISRGFTFIFYFLLALTHRVVRYTEGGYNSRVNVEGVANKAKICVCCCLH